MESIYKQWQNGEISDKEALDALVEALNRVQDKIVPLQETEKILRVYLSEVVERLGGRTEVEGFGLLQITSASLNARYDRKGLDELVGRLRYEGHADLADEIASYRQESSKAGGLVIRRPRGE